MFPHNATITDNECLERLKVFNGPGVTRRQVIELQYAKYKHARKERKQPETYEPTYDPSEEKPQVSQPITLDVVIKAMGRGIFLGGLNKCNCQEGMVPVLGGESVPCPHCGLKYK